MDITLKEINCLLKIIDSGSFSAAADEINLSQPTISNHIANLEKKLNITLLLRKRDGVRPSPAGKIVYRSGNTIETRLKN
ncbi:MAG: LysR family transcriptional regulator, partial [Elusimicrobia bacterium]|nr:LysR family transcriptional regulator [Elusimicrobiota bacterium]